MTKLRVLAVQAEPAELILTADAGLPSTILTALAVDPHAQVTTAFALCTAQGQLPGADIACPGDAGLPLDSTGPLQARLDFNDARVQALALAALQGLGGADAGADGGGAAEVLAAGFPVLLGLEATAPAGLNSDGGPPANGADGLQHLGALATVTLRSASTDRPLNHNPQIAALQLNGADLPADGSGQVKAGVQVTLLPIPCTIALGCAADAKEPTGAGPEKLNYSFFATAGELGSLRSADTTATGQPGISSVDWTAPKDSATARIWVVVRDGRGGVGWLQRDIQVVP